MATIFLRTNLSGNHGSDNTLPPHGSNPSQSVNTRLTQSSRPFIAPNLTVRRSPNISDLTAEMFSTEKRDLKTTAPTPEKTDISQSTPLINTEPISTSEQINTTIDSTINSSATTTSTSELSNVPTNNIEESTSPQTITQETFTEQWKTMFEIVFKDSPVIYCAYAEYIPTFENNIIQFTANNEFQKDAFESKKRDVLEYLRSNLSNTIDDIIVNVKTDFVAKKVIYDNKDKFANFAQENSEFESFISILNLNMKT